MSNEFTIVQLQEHLGFKVTAEFVVSELLVPADRSEKKAKFWNLESYAKIITAFQAHLVEKSATLPNATTSKPAPAAKSAPKSTFSDDDEEF